MLRSYKALVWIGEQPGIRETVVAESLDDALRQLKENYGEGRVISVWNEDDAAETR